MTETTGRRLRIAMIGQRGVPATFGGIEHHVEEVGARLAARGHEVSVYTRSNYASQRRSSHRGMRVRTLPTLDTKHLDAITHSALSSLAAVARRYDVVHYHALGPGLTAPVVRALSRSKVVLTVHGLDDERAKWGSGARSVLKVAGWMSGRVPHATVVVSRALATHYAAWYARPTTCIPNGVAAPAVAAGDPSSPPCVLFVGRLVPEKAPDLLIEAFRDVPGDVRLVLAGGSSFTDDYVARLRALAAADPRVSLPGYVYGADLERLYRGAAAFCLPSQLEGLPLTLLEAAAYGVPVVASAIAPHVEVLGRSAPGRRLFPPGDRAALTAALVASLRSPAAERAGAAALRASVLARYDWDVTVDRLEGLYLSLVG
jgi:glycosyltransferase involved in cell wall biosynthesis